MNTLRFFIFTLALFLGGCDISNFGLNHKTVPESENHPHHVSEANPSWLSKELKERVSPPKTAISTKVDSLVVAIHYSSPGVKGREIWDNLVPYDEVWRTGADEATMLELSNDAIIGGKRIKPGRYSLFTIPGKDEWTFIINGVFDQWGAFQYDKHKKSDIVRFTAQPETAEFTENLSFSFQKESKKETFLQLNWDKLKVGFEIQKYSSEQL